MSFLVNGKLFDNITEATIPSNDRGLLYGHSVFETISVSNNTPLLFQSHLQRLKLGAQRLQIPYSESSLVDEVKQLCHGVKLGVIRATLTIGSGGRGYQNPVSPKGTRIVSLHDYPDYPKIYWEQGINLGVADIRLATQPALAGIKHGNRLEQVIARAQWQDDWQEALLLGQDGQVIEATQSNVFALKGQQLSTPCLDSAGVAGVMREYVLSVADKVGVATQSVSLSVSDLTEADAVFVTNSIIGLWPVKQFINSQYDDLTVSTKLLNLMKKDGVIPTI